MLDPSKLQITALARSLAASIYRATSMFPDSERFGLTAQMRRSAVSIGSNICEGCGRNGPRDFARFLHIALGSATELEFQALLAGDLKLLDADVAAVLLDEIEHLKLMLVRFVKALHARTASTGKR